MHCTQRENRQSRLWKDQWGQTMTLRQQIFCWAMMIWLIRKRKLRLVVLGQWNWRVPFIIWAASILGTMQREFVSTTSFKISIKVIAGMFDSAHSNSCWQVINISPLNEANRNCLNFNLQILIKIYYVLIFKIVIENEFFGQIEIKHIIWI